MRMDPHSYDGYSSDTPLHWLAARAAETFADNPPAAEAWLHRPRRDLAGFTPAQCAEVGGAALTRAASLLLRRREDDATASVYERPAVGGLGTVHATL